MSAISGEVNPTRYKVAAIQFEPKLFQKEQNLSKALELTKYAAEEGAKLIVLPEMATTGYSWYSREEISPYVEEIPGPTTSHFARLAREYRCYIFVGLPEVEPVSESFYNSIAVIGPGGFLTKYRKTHLFIADSRWAREGDLDFTVLETEFGRIAGLICQDLMYFEPARILALKDADVICVPSNWLRSRLQPPVWSMRAFENGLYVICANRYGTEREVTFLGNSSIINPDGGVQERVGEEERVIFGEIDLSESRSKTFPRADGGNKILDRHPASYHLLSLNPYLHNPSRFFGLNNYKPLPKGRRSLIATLSTAPAQTSQGERLARIEQTLIQGMEAAPLPLQLVVLQDSSDSDAGAPQTSGLQVEAAEELAARLGLYLVWGATEREAGKSFRACFLAGPQGMIGKYRGVHLSPEDRRRAAVGDVGFPTFDLPVGRVGLLSGYDLLFPESARCLALSGADLICVPSSLESLGFKSGATADSLSEVEDWELFSHTRAGENLTYLAVAGRARFGGGVFGPSLWYMQKHGRIEFPDGSVMIQALIDTGSHHDSYQANMVRRKELLALRQTRWYDPLFLPMKASSSP
jgi:predicted amidohydrolase